MAEMSHPEASAEGFTQAKKDSELTVYEIGYHVVPTVVEDKVISVVERIRSTVEKAGGTILAEESPKRMTLAYRIERSAAGKREKYTESWFGWIKFETKSEGMPELQKTLTADREILRFLLIDTVRELPQAAPRAVFTSDRLEGETIRKPDAPSEKSSSGVSEEELEKSIEALTA